MNTLDKICRMASEKEILDMLQEECAELIQAASKTKRVMNGDRSVDPRKARLNLIEELGDVQNMLTLTAKKLLTVEENWDVCVGEFAKLERYCERLKERERHDAKLDD